MLTPFLVFLKTEKQHILMHREGNLLQAWTWWVPAVRHLCPDLQQDSGPPKDLGSLTTVFLAAQLLNLSGSAQVSCVSTCCLLDKARKYEVQEEN